MVLLFNFFFIFYLFRMLLLKETWSDVTNNTACSWLWFPSQERQLTPIYRHHCENLRILELVCNIPWTTEPEKNHIWKIRGTATLWSHCPFPRWHSTTQRRSLSAYGFCSGKRASPGWTSSSPSILEHFSGDLLSHLIGVTRGICKA